MEAIGKVMVLVGVEWSRLKWWCRCSGVVVSISVSVSVSVKAKVQMII